MGVEVTEPATRPTSTRRWRRAARAAGRPRRASCCPDQARRRRRVRSLSCAASARWPSRRARRRCRRFPTSTSSATSGRATPPRSHVPRRHQLRASAARVHGVARGADARARRGRRCSPTSTARTTPCPPTCGNGCAGRTIRHVVTGRASSVRTTRRRPSTPSSARTRSPAAPRSTSRRRSAAPRSAGWSGRGGGARSPFLIAHSTRDGQRLPAPWRPGDVVMWDNGCVLHRADHDGVVGDRVMHRGMVAGYAA